MAGSPGRIIGLETEFAIVSAHTVPMPPGTENPIAPPEAVAELYRGTPQEYRARNRFLPNGGRLYVDLGSHPEYATAECRSIHDVVAQDRAGESILRAMTERANASLLERGVQARIHIVKNNRDALGATFGCHENYQVSRSTVDQLSSECVSATRPSWLTESLRRLFLPLGLGVLAPGPLGTECPLGAEGRLGLEAPETFCARGGQSAL